MQDRTADGRRRAGRQLCDEPVGLVAGLEFRGGENKLMRIVAIDDEGDVWRVEPVEAGQVPMSE